MYPTFLLTAIYILFGACWSFGATGSRPISAGTGDVSDSETLIAEGTTALAFQDVDALISTFLGGSGDDGIGAERGVDAVIDSAGNIYVVANTTSSDLPAVPGCYTCGSCGGQDIVLAKFNPTLSELLALAVIGGSGDESDVAVAIGEDSLVYILTNTVSSNYPTTAGAYSQSRSGSSDFAVSRFNADLTELVASSYFGGNASEAYVDIAVGGDGGVFISGLVASSGFPTTVGAYSRTLAGSIDFFLSKLSGDLTSLLASTYIGGQYAEEFPTIALDGSGAVIISGRSESDDYPATSGAYDETFSGPPAPGQNLQDLVVSKLSGDLTTLMASTFLGGPGYDGALQTAIDPAGNIIVAGHSTSSDFPATPGSFDDVFNGGNEYFISKFDPGLSTLIASSFLSPENLGTGEAVFGTALTCDNSGNILLTGVAWGTAMPTTDSAYDRTFNGGMTDAMALELTSDLSTLQYGSYLGGSGTDYFAVGIRAADGSLVIAGNTASTDFPTSTGTYQQDYAGGATDLFVIRLGYDCCEGPYAGNVDCEGIVDIGDVTELIQLLFIRVNDPYCCEDEADLDYNGLIDIGDLTILINRLFISVTDPPPCP